MKKNKIIDQIVKKLIINGFDKEQIFQLIKLNEKFCDFKNYIYYLLLLSQCKYDDYKFIMANTIHQYLNYLSEEYQIKSLTIDDLVVNNLYCNEELYVIGAKGFGSNKNFYFDVDDNLYILLNDENHSQYKNLINIKYNNGFLNNKTNNKIIQQNFNQILVFEKLSDKNIFLGKFQFLFNTKIYLKDMQNNSFLIGNKENIDENIINEFINLNDKKRDIALNNLKEKIIPLILENKKTSSKLISNINNSLCHTTLIDAVVQYCLLTKEINLLEKIVDNFPDFYQYKLQLFDLIPFRSLINEYQLYLLSNSLDILKGINITSDYLNNIFICSDNLVKETNDIFSLRFIKSFKGDFFDIKLNQKIFNTTFEPTAIYLFKKYKNMYLFLGIFNCFKITLGKDLKNQETPIFKFKKLNDISLIRHLNYINDLKVSTNYKNTFFNFVQNNSSFNKWTKQKYLEKTKVKEVDIDRLNSSIYKYNWLVNKTLNEIKKEKDIYKYLELFKKFDDKYLKKIFEVQSNNFLSLCQKKLLEPHTIAYEMTKNNWTDKILFDLSYIDYYPSKSNKYNMIINVINNKKYL